MHVDKQATPHELIGPSMALLLCRGQRTRVKTGGEASDWTEWYLTMGAIPLSITVTFPAEKGHRTTAMIATWYTCNMSAHVMYIMQSCSIKWCFSRPSSAPRAGGPPGIPRPPGSTQKTQCWSKLLYHLNSQVTKLGCWRCETCWPVDGRSGRYNLIWIVYNQCFVDSLQRLYACIII